MSRKHDQVVVSREAIRTGIIVLGAFVVLMVVSVASFRYAKNRTPQIVLPNGLTYTGPASPNRGEPTATPPQASAPALSPDGTIPVPKDVTWTTQTGKVYPYSFSYPSVLSLGVFPGDPFDSVTIFWGSTNPQENLLLRVEDLTKIPGMGEYVGKSKKEYAGIWWKQYSWKGVTSVTEFTNNKGLKGHRATYTDSSGKSSYDNVFFEVPARPNLVIWMASKLLTPEVFDIIVDSVSWGK